MVQIQRFSGFESLEGSRSDADDMLKPPKLERGLISHFRKNTMGYIIIWPWYFVKNRPKIDFRFQYIL